MGLIDNIRGFFGGSKNTQPVQVENEYEKARLSEEIVDLVGKIKRINSFDSRIWNLSNISSFELKRRSLAELQNLHSSLKNRLSEIYRQSKGSDSRKETLEASKWTGRRPENMSAHDFNRFQQDDDCR